jgi:threonine/homoserine efflux transporter RhtA
MVSPLIAQVPPPSALPIDVETVALSRESEQTFSLRTSLLVVSAYIKLAVSYVQENRQS